MTKTLLKYLSILSVVFFVANVAFAQVESGKSRLDIGKKQASKVVTAPSNLRLQRFVSYKPSEIKLGKNTAVNQYFRNALLSKSSNTNKAVVNEVVTKNAESSTIEGGQADKLYASDRITVSNIYPNPANDYASVDFSMASSVNSANLTFFNILGSEVGSFELDKSDRKLRVQTSDWESGIYFYQLNVDGKKLITKKLLVRHN